MKMFASRDRDEMPATQDDNVSCRTTQARRLATDSNKVPPTPKFVSRASLETCATLLHNESHEEPEDLHFKKPSHRQHLVGVEKFASSNCATSRRCAIVLFCLTIILSYDHLPPTSKCHSKQQSAISDTHRPSFLIGRVDALQVQPSPSTSSPPASTTNQQTTNVSTDSSSSPAPQASSIQRRDLDSVGRQNQDKGRPAVTPTVGNVCQVSHGESVAIVEIEESRGSDMSQVTNPSELPISGSVELDEIELKIESETHKYFRIQNKSLKLIRPLDRDAVMKENSSQIVQQAVTSIYLQISCIDKRAQQRIGTRSGNSNDRARKVIIPVLVKVLDLNDQAPKFTQPVYSVQVNELAPVGTIILDQFAHAIDLDSANNGQVEYSLLGQSTPYLSSTIATTSNPASVSNGSTTGATSSTGTTSWRDKSKNQNYQLASTNQRLIQRAPQGDGRQEARAGENKPQATAATVATSIATTNLPISSTVIKPTIESRGERDGQHRPTASVVPSASLANSSSQESSRDDDIGDDDNGQAQKNSLSSSKAMEVSASAGSGDPALVSQRPSGDQPTPSSYESAEMGPSASTATSANYKNSTPTINLNSEPILNGPMDETDEEESDEALLASMNLNNNSHTNSSDSEAPDEPDLASADSIVPAILRLPGDSLQSSLHEQARQMVHSNHDDNSSRQNGLVRGKYIRKRRRSKRHASVAPTTSAADATSDFSTTVASNPRERNRQQVLTSMSVPFVTTTTTTAVTMALKTRPVAASSDAPVATTTANPPWTNLMVIANMSEDFQLANDHQSRAIQNQLDEQLSGAGKDSDEDSSEFFSLELAPLTGRPVIKLKRQLDYETKRVHKLTLVATDRATNKQDRLSSQVKIIVRVLDGDDQPPAFLLDQVGCATGSLPHQTTPIPSPTTTAVSLITATSPADVDLMQVDSIVGRHTKQPTKIGSTSISSSSAAGDSTAMTRSNLQQLRSFRVTDENFDFGDTLDLDDAPLDDGPQQSGTNSANAATARRALFSSSDQQPLVSEVAGPRSHPVSGSAAAFGAVKLRQQNMLTDYLCLVSNQNQNSMSLDGTGQLTIEYFATVVSGDSDYLLRVAPQSIKARDRDELNAPIRYSFINGTPENYTQYFHINPLDAAIKQIQPVERTQVDEFVLYVKAEEQSYNRLFSVAKLTIDVLPTDKNPPVLMPNSYHGFVDENSPIGTRIIVARSSSARSEPSDIANTTSQSSMSLLSPVYLQISVVDVESTTSSSRILKDARNNGTSGQRQLGSGLGVQSLHSSPKQLVNYEFETTSDAFKVDRNGYVYVNKFPLDRDGPNQAVHMFQVTAHQAGLLSAKSMSSPVSLNITLLDQNDNPPVLVNSTLGPVQMAANSQGGVQFVTQIMATDKDSPEHSRMHFSIVHVSNNGAQRFRVDEESGRIEALGKFKAGEQFSLTVQVADEPGRWSQGILDVQVVPGANTGGPQFVIDGQERDNSRGYFVEINEGVAVNSIVLQVRASDPENDPITYSLISGNINGDFSINSKTGALIVANKLDREEISAYKLIVQARDSGGLATSRPIHVTITDSNDQNPVFNQAHYVFTVEEGTETGPGGLPLGRVFAQDGDEGDNGRISYSLLSLKPAYAGASEREDGNGAGYEFVEVGSTGSESKRDLRRDDRGGSGGGGGSKSLFSIDDKTGELRLLEPLDYERARSHTLLVVARDSGENPRSSSASVQVKVVDRQDESPYFERYYIETRLDENLSGHRLAVVQARDPDSVAQISYVLLSGNPSLFQVDAQTGLVSTVAGLDYEQARQHTLLVGTIESDISTEELAKVAQKLSASLTAASSSGSGSVTSGRVGLQQDATTGHDRWPIVRIDVHVNDINDNAPQFDSVQPLPVRIQDSVPLGTALSARLQAHDRDGSAPNNQIRYELVVAPSAGYTNEPVTSEKCAQLFLVDPSSGQVSVKADLKRESLSECQLVVRARDLPNGSPIPPPPTQVAPLPEVARRLDVPHSSSSGSLSSICVLTVFIDHLAEISPGSMVSFADTSYFVELDENVPGNTLVKLLPVINKPRVAFPMSCELISGNELNKFYVIENEQRDCELRSRDNSLDYEARQRYNLMVKLNTIGGVSSRATLAQIQVNIVDKNDNRPVFSQPARYSHLTQMRFLAAIASDSPSDTQVLQVRARDADSPQANGLISYELLNGHELEGRFKVDPIDGIIRTSRPIEDIPATRLPIKLRVLARDNPEQASESLESTVEIVVNLIDDNYRIGLVLKDTPAGRVLDNKEELLAVLQERTGLISGLERVESLKVQRNTSRPVVEADVSGTDFWFYLIEPGTMRLVPNDDQRLKVALFEARAQNSLADIIGQQLGFAKVHVRLPYSLTRDGVYSHNSNSLASLSGPSNLLFGTIRADSSDRLAQILILIAIFIGIMSAILLAYQCSSSRGWSESANFYHQAAQMQQYQQQQCFRKDKFLFSPPPPPQSALNLTTASGTQTPLGSQLAGTDRFGTIDPYSMGASFANDSAAPVGATNYTIDQQQQQHVDYEREPYLGGNAQMTREYETQMLKMSVLFDDSQSFDEQNLADQNLSKNLM